MHAAARYSSPKHIYRKKRTSKRRRTEVAALEKLGTAEALQYAKELRQEISLGSVKNLFDGIVEKVLPELGIGDKPATSEDVK